MYGTTSPAAGQFLLVMVPVLWLSKLRQLRLVTKIVQYLVLPVIPSIEFLMPLLPAPMQVIAVETARMNGEGEQGPIVPKGKGKGGVKQYVPSGAKSGVGVGEEGDEMDIDEEVEGEGGEGEEADEELADDAEEPEEPEEQEEAVEADDDVNDADAEAEADDEDFGAEDEEDGDGGDGDDE